MKHFLTQKFNKWTADLLHIIYPQSCLICQHEFNQSALAICPICISELNYTFFESYSEPTKLDKLFWGRIPMEATYALLTFKQQGATQRLLHALKYQNQPEVGFYFGRELGSILQKHPLFQSADALVPVPLHTRKKFMRGYNQAEIICRGIEEITGIPIREDLLKRAQFTESQTKKDRMSRWENMQNRFKTSFSKVQSCKHIVLVDDVVTTGSTLESCARVLRKQFPETKISVAVLAIA